MRAFPIRELFFKEVGPSQHANRFYKTRFVNAEPYPVVFSRAQSTHLGALALGVHLVVITVRLELGRGLPRKSPKIDSLGAHDAVWDVDLETKARVETTLFE